MYMILTCHTPGICSCCFLPGVHTPGRYLRPCFFWGNTVMEPLVFCCLWSVLVNFAALHRQPSKPARQSPGKKEKQEREFSWSLSLWNFSFIKNSRTLMFFYTRVPLDKKVLSVFVSVNVQMFVLWTWCFLSSYENTQMLQNIFV